MANNIFLFLGSEELMIKNKIEKLVASVSTNSYNITTYDMEENNVSMAVQDAMTAPFMTDYKVVIIKNPTFLTKEKSSIEHKLNLFEQYLDHPVEETFFIIDATLMDLDDKNELVQKLKKKAQISDTKELSEIEIKGWLKRQCALLDVSIDDSAIELFFNRVGSNMIYAQNELNKVFNYIGDKKNITLKDISLVVSKSIETNVYDLINAIVTKEKNKIVALYQVLIRSGKDPILLFNLISKFMREIYTTSSMLQANYKQADIAQKMGVSTGRAYYLVKDARSFPLKVIEEKIIALGELDYQIKTGQIDKTTGLELFLFTL